MLEILKRTPRAAKPVGPERYVLVSNRYDARYVGDGERGIVHVTTSSETLGARIDAHGVAARTASIRRVPILGRSGTTAPGIGVVIVRNAGRTGAFCAERPIFERDAHDGIFPSLPSAAIAIQLNGTRVPDVNTVRIRVNHPLIAGMMRIGYGM